MSKELAHIGNNERSPSTGLVVTVVMAVRSDLDEAHIHYLVVIERVTSGLSVAGCLFVIITFLVSKSFHRPINRLVFFASVGNLFTNIATVTASAVLDKPSSFLCQAQGFLIQMYVLQCG